MRTVLVLAIALSILVATVSGCGKGVEKVRVGFAGPLSGSQARVGQDARQGVQLAVDEWNAKGGVLGRRIEVSALDDLGNPEEAPLVARKIVSRRVAGIIGHLNSDCSLAAAPIYHEFYIPQISPASTNPKLTELGFENFFRTCGRDDQQGLVAAQFVRDVLKLSRVAVFHDRTTYGQGLSQEFMRNLGPFVGVLDYEGLGSAEDIETALTRVKPLRPEVVYFGGMYPQGIALARAIKKAGLECVLLGGDGLFNSEFVKQGGLSVEGTCVSFAPSIESMPQARHFVEAYRRKYGDVGAYSVYAYEATNILLSAIAQVGSTDGEKIAKAIHGQKFSGALGELQFDFKGDVSKAPYVIWIVRGGKFVPY